MNLQIEVTDSLACVSSEQWNALCEDDNPFLRHEFLHTLDETGCLGDSTGWYPRYFLLYSEEAEQRELLAAVPTYAKTNSYGEFVFDWAWAEAYERHQMDYYPKLVSSIPFTPATGQRLLVRSDQPYEQTILLMAGAVRQFAESQNFSSVHYLFLSERESNILSAIEPVPQTFNAAKLDDGTGNKAATSNVATAKTDADGTMIAHTPDDTESAASAGKNTDGANEAVNKTKETQRSVSANDHLRRLDCQYHWHNANYCDFEDFLAHCNAKRRKTIRRERRHVSDAGLRLEQRLGSSMSSTEWRWAHELYCSTFDRKWGNPWLTQAFFETVSQKMGNQVLVVFAYDPADEQPEQPIACAIMFMGKETLYGRYWGCRSEFNSLHFETCYYQGIDYCIANGIQNFEPGAQGEHKITRGFVPTITRSAHYISHPGFRDVIAHFLANERPYVEQRCSGLTNLLPFKSDNLSL